MRKPKSFLRVFTDTGPLAVLAVVIAFLVGIVGPASAQFFNFGGFGGPPQRQAPQRGGGGGWLCLGIGSVFVVVGSSREMWKTGWSLMVAGSSNL